MIENGGLLRNCSSLFLHKVELSLAGKNYREKANSFSEGKKNTTRTYSALLVINASGETRCDSNWRRD